MHFGISEDKGGGVKTWKPSMVGYGYFLELPNIAICSILFESLERDFKINQLLYSNNNPLTFKTL